MAESPAPVPRSERSQWVSATRTRNHMLGDPLLDWLDVHGPDRGYLPDATDERTDYGTFIMQKGVQFESRVMEHLSEMFPVVTVEGRAGSEEATRRTWEAMTAGVPIIHQASLTDHHNRVYGSADFLIRADTLEELFPGILTPDQVRARAGLLGDWHYVTVDVKYATLRFGTKGNLLNSGSAPAYKAQVVLYNRALGYLQGYHPPKGYLLGRGWQQTINGETVRNADCMDRLAGVAPNDKIRGTPVVDLADMATQWIRDVRRRGHAWDVVPPSAPQLRPNATTRSGEWATVTKRLVEETEDLTRLWHVGPAKRQAANRRDLTAWTDPRVTAATLGFSGKTAAIVDEMLHVNRGPAAAAVTPRRVRAERHIWRPVPRLEFYVDFETVSDVHDDFSRFPHKNGQPLIFMIGCGHIENDKWTFECFTADRLTPVAERTIIGDWYEHMRTVTRRVATGLSPRVFHWSAAETASLETAWNSARARHPDQLWDHVEWYDFLSRVVRKEPLIVKNAHGFGLKNVTRALHDLGVIDCEWETGPADGLGAMVGAWWCQNQIDLGRAADLRDVPLMKEIEKYNETDCRAMMEVVSYLRTRH